MAVATDTNPKWVFLNIPYDREFESLYLAYIAGLGMLGMTPRVTFAISGGQRRLGRILDLIRSCRYSIHDLSRIEVGLVAPFTPRFNMPFELGLSVAWAEMSPAEHTWFVFEAQERRIQASLSDLNGTDIQVHEGTVPGVMRELCNCFVGTDPRVGVPEMLAAYHALRDRVDTVLQTTGARSLYEARVFRDLCWIAGMRPNLGI